MKTLKPLSLGIEIQAPWPSTLPSGCLIEEGQRHCDLALLPSVAYSSFQHHLVNLEPPPIKVGRTGYFDSCGAFPSHQPKEVRWHIHQNGIDEMQNQLIHWLLPSYLVKKVEKVLFAVVCRQPTDAAAWIETFTALPLFMNVVHLYVADTPFSYQSLWSFPFVEPFEEKAHTADMAFIIRGENLQQLYQNALTALAFKAPYLIRYFAAADSIHDLDDVTIALNRVITHADAVEGCPFKAISFHGELVHLEHSILQWEMIVDV